MYSRKRNKSEKNYESYWVVNRHCPRSLYSRYPVHLNSRVIFSRPDDTLYFYNSTCAVFTRATVIFLTRERFFYLSIIHCIFEIQLYLLAILQSALSLHDTLYFYNSICTVFTRSLYLESDFTRATRELPLYVTFYFHDSTCPVSPRDATFFLTREWFFLLPTIHRIFVTRTSRHVYSTRAGTFFATGERSFFHFTLRRVSTIRFARYST